MDSNTTAFENFLSESLATDLEGLEAQNDTSDTYRGIVNDLAELSDKELLKRYNAIVPEGFEIASKDKEAIKNLSETLGLEANKNDLGEKGTRISEAIARLKRAQKTRKTVSASSGSDEGAKKTPAKSVKKAQKSASGSGSGSEDTKAKKPKAKALKKKTVPAGKGKARGAAGSAKVIPSEKKDDLEGLPDSFWESTHPGANEAADIKSEEEDGDLLQTDKERRRKEAKRNDLLTKYKPAEGFTYKRYFQRNLTLIKGLNITNNNFAEAFGRYGNDARFKFVGTSNFEDKFTENPEYRIIDKARLERMKNLATARLKVYEFWMEAKGKRPAVEPKTPVSGVGNLRYVLSSEGIDWLHAEKFRAPENKEPVYKGKTYSDLWSFLQARLGKKKEQTHLWKGELIKKSFATLAARALASHTAVKSDSEKARIKAAGIKVSAGKYKWSPAMVSNLGKGTKATWNRELVVDEKTGKEKLTRVDNTTKSSVIDLVAEETKARVKAQEGKRAESPIYATDKYIWSTNIASLAEYLMTNDLKTHADKKFAGEWKTNQDYIQEVIDEANAIKEFSDGIKNAAAAAKKKKTVGPRGRRGSA